jgi:predicted alpha/beta superfamily hydrolase
MRRSPRSGRWVRLAILACLALGAKGVAGAEEGVDLRHLQGLGEVRYHRLESDLLQRGYHLFVRLPESYAERSDHSFPTVYLLDGGVTFPLLAAYYRYLSLAEEVPDLILVGISYGTADWRQGNMRSTDFTAPSPEREHWGGAARFQEVLRRELLPLVEGSYRSDPQRRILFGQSLGGQFVLFSALEDEGPFWGHIASNPALHRNLERFLEAPERTREGERLRRSRVYVSSAELDEERFRKPALRWMEHWQGRAPGRWSLKTETLEGHGHFSAAPEAFRRGMRWLFRE